MLGGVYIRRWSTIPRPYLAYSSLPYEGKPGTYHPLSKRCMIILEQAQSLSDGSKLVFTGTRPGKALSDMTLSKLVKELGCEAHVHGFRTSFKTWAQEKSDFPDEVSEMALAHTIVNKAKAAYARSPPTVLAP